MLRFIAWLLHREYEDCKTCVSLREQLVYERQVNKELTETLTSLLRPAPIIQQPIGEPQVVAGPTLWSRKRRELEMNDRILAQQLRHSNLQGKPDSDQASAPASTPVVQTVEQLEKELNVNQEEQEERQNAS
jgi:hypothetical protein